MKAIVTKYVGPSERRGSRIVATAEGGKQPFKVIVSYDDESRDPYKDVDR